MLLALIIMAACETSVLDEGIFPASIELDVTDVELVSGKSAVIRATLKDGRGRSIAAGAGGAKVEWSSSDDRIASVSEQGQVTARVTAGAGGTAEITATVRQEVMLAGLFALLQGQGQAKGRKVTTTASVQVVAADLVYVDGDEQTGTPGSTLPKDLVVRAVDEDGKGVPGIEIEFSARGGSGSVDPAKAVTDETGKARTRWTLGDGTGTMRVDATGHKLPRIRFTATSVEESGDDDGGQNDGGSDGGNDGDDDSGSDDSGSDGGSDGGGSTQPPPPGVLPAFPGAEGWGATALNECRSLPLVVHKVTNTNDSGSGSLRDVLENRVRGDRFDVVVFTTGGLIRLESDLYRRGAHCLYVAGQTAPGGGISLVGRGVEFRNSNDVIVRHLRHRGANSNAFLHRGGRRMIYDHITSSWTAGRYLLRLDGGEGRRLEAGTVQNSLLYEPDESHSTVLGVTGAPRELPEASRVSVHRNVLMGPGHRMPSCGALEVSIVNNLIYNWFSRASEISASSECDFIANYHKPGPATPSAHANRRPFANWDSSGGLDGSVFSWSTYIADNRNSYNNFTPTSGDKPWEDPSREVGCRPSTSDSWCENAGDPVPAEFRRFSRLPPAPIPLAMRPISDALVNEILAVAGHSRRLKCDGSWIPIRDDVDAARIQWFKDGGGFSARIRAADMVVPVPARGTACADADSDGLPDDWEKRFFGCTTCGDPTAIGHGGYLVIEHYLNGTDPN